MKVYHGGTDIIQLPLVNVGRDELDFGKGFYVTDIKNQAEVWAIRLADHRAASPIINVYELDMDKAVAQYRYKKFTTYDQEWLDFIIVNRRGMEAWKSFDLIEGGVADDRVVDTVESYIAELISAEQALTRLAHFDLNNQLFITHQGLVAECLHFVEYFTLNTK